MTRSSDIARRTDIVLVISDEKVPKVGMGIAVPVDDGRDWWELGDIIATELESDGRIRVSIELAPGVELSEPPEEEGLGLETA